jgi:hypothetical protein
MSEPTGTVNTSAPKAAKERSPSFPFIPLSTAIGRLEAFERTFGRHPTPANKVGLAWEMKPASSQAAQTVAALKSFGMVEYEGSGPDRLTSITEDGRNYLRAQQASVKQEIARRFAMNPKVIAKYWEEWGSERPMDAVALDHLVLKAAFTESAAATFLTVYDETIAFAGLSDSDKTKVPSDGGKLEDEPPVQEFGIGDWVSVEAGGQVIFNRTRVRALNPPWVFVEASQTGAKMEDVTLLERAKPQSETGPVLPFEQAREEREGEEMDRFTVDEGVVEITFPSGMTVDSVEELEQFFTLFIKKAKRRAGAAQKPG